LEEVEDKNGTLSLGESLDICIKSFLGYIF